MDWIAGAVVGVLVLSLRGWLADLYSLPADLVLVMGLANLAYACVSFTLAMLSRGDSVPLLRMVALANFIWAVICVVLAVVWFGEGSVVGLATLVGEGLFVGGLGVLEWLAAGRRGSADAEPGAAADGGACSGSGIQGTLGPARR